MVQNTAVAKLKAQVIENRQKAKPIEILIQKSLEELGKAVPSCMSAERLVRIALTTIRLYPKLAECTPESFLGALFQSAQLGLEPNVEGQAYIIPYKNSKKTIDPDTGKVKWIKVSEAQFQIGYKGYIELFYRHGAADYIDMHTVYENDLFEAIHTLLQRLKLHDKYLLKHSLAVAQCVIYFSQELSLPKIGQKNLIIASLIHDVGYLNLNFDRENTGKLTPEEWMQIKCHPYIATNIILPPFPVFNDCLDIIKDHHEYIDGSGYPLGKKSTDISIYSQVLSISDTYTAVREDRPHRRALRFDEIIDIFIKSAGIKWNENLVTMFLATIADTEFRHKINDPNFDAITQFIDNIIQY